MSDQARAKNLIIGLAGAVAGGLLGYFVFFWAAHQGFYALILPGAAAGMGGGLFVRDKSVVRGIICGLLALAFGLVAEWHFAPFIANPGFGYFLTHVHELRPLTLIMIAAGAVFGFWLALGKVSNPAPKNP